MSGANKQGGRNIGDVERENRRDRKNREREERHRDANVVAAINAIANQLAANEREQERSDRKRGFREKVTIGLVLLTFVAAGFGDVIFLRTMIDARHAAKKAHSDNFAALHRADVANKQASDFFQDAQEPIIWETSDLKILKHDAPDWHTVPDGKGRGLVDWDMTLFNYGNGMAFNISAVYRMDIHGTSCNQWSLPGHSVPLPPKTQSVNTGLCINWLASHSEFKKLMTQNYSITLREIITYTDSFGRKYETDICRTNLATGAIEWCPGNDIHRIKHN